jgi:hypothetical protein
MQIKSNYGIENVLCHDVVYYLLRKGIDLSQKTKIFHYSKIFFIQTVNS